MELQTVKQRFGIIGNDEKMNRALEIALKVASTELSVLITGESGVGKEFFPQIIHSYSSRKHGNYIAVNCGAIPEGTIDSELFGHEKGSFTGATDSRKGYFEIADGGTIFLDEVAELPHTTQVRLLRVLQTGEFIKVGSSKVQKSNARVVAATNINLTKAIEDGRFREDLYYRLNTVPIIVPALRDRKGDIYTLFRKFVIDISSQYKMPAITLTPEARKLLESYSWPGNIRQLKNVAEQISVIEENRVITDTVLTRFLPVSSAAPALNSRATDSASSSRGDFGYDREIIFSLLREMRMDIAELKQILLSSSVQPSAARERQYNATPIQAPIVNNFPGLPSHTPSLNDESWEEAEIVDESESKELTKEQVQKEAIVRALARHGGKRKEAAKELFISERTLYRRIKELGIDE